MRNIISQEELRFIIRKIENIILDIDPNIFECEINMGDVVHMERIAAGLEVANQRYQTMIDVLRQ